MIKEPLVSVVMPAFNCEPYIKQAITSILNQSYKNLELLICDDGSSDRTVQVASSFSDSRVKIIRNPANLGNLKTRNKLFELATGEYIAVQDADDWSDLNRLSLQVAALENDRSLGACVSCFKRVDLNGNVYPVRDALKEDIIIGPDYIDPLPFHMPSIIIRKSVYQQVGGLNPYFDRLFAEDHYWVYLIRERFKLLCLKEELYYYRFNPESLTNTIDNIRKLAITDVVHFLIQQRREKGTDWLEEKEFEKISLLESSFLNSKKWLAEKYRLYAAVKVDAGRMSEARSLLLKSFKLYPFAVNNFRTLLYYLKKAV